MESGLQYDPLEAPEPEEWLAIDEAERIHLAQDYHRRTRVRLPNEKLHAVFHVVVENQIALGDEMPVQSTVQRLMAEDLHSHAGCSMSKTSPHSSRLKSWIDARQRLRHSDTC